MFEGKRGETGIYQVLLIAYQVLLMVLEGWGASGVYQVQGTLGGRQGTYGVRKAPQARGGGAVLAAPT